MVSIDYAVGVWGKGVDPKLKMASAYRTNFLSRYHSIKDPRLPSEFVCFDCRVRADSSWELIKVNLYPIMLSRFEDLALFRHVLARSTLAKSLRTVDFAFNRRAIKIAEKKKAGTPADLAKAYGNIILENIFYALID